MSDIIQEQAVFGFQWHITNKCKLRCAHCYQDDFSGSNEMDLDGLKLIADKITTTLTKWNKKGDCNVVFTSAH